MITERLVIRDEVWEKVSPHLPGKVTDRGVTAADNRLFLEAVLWRVRTGSPWRDLPPALGKWNSVFQRFLQWAKKGVFEHLFEVLSENPDFEYALIDSTIVSVQQKASGARGGDSKSGHRAIQRRPDHQDRRAGGCLGKSGALRAPAWSTP